MPCTKTLIYLKYKNYLINWLNNQKGMEIKNLNFNLA
jgi:hypothetical protein